MLYSSVRFSIEPYSVEFIDILSALLDMYGFDGVYEDGESITAYIPRSRFDNDTILSVERTLFSSGCKVSWECRDILEQNWNALWEKNFEPVIIAGQCVIRAPFHPEFPDAKYQLIISPKMSFGTGHHQTTHLMIESLLKIDFNGKSVLDMGCGTGILGIMASVLGAKNVVAIDTDLWAYENAIENAGKNNVHNMEVIKGDKEKIPDKEFDIILANINRNILLDQVGYYAKAAKKGGLLLISGILEEDVPALKSGAGSVGFKYINSFLLDKWAMMIFDRI